MLFGPPQGGPFGFDFMRAGALSSPDNGPIGDTTTPALAAPTPTPDPVGTDTNPLEVDPSKITIPILTVAPDPSNGKPPFWWCLPYWHEAVDGWLKTYTTTLTSACPNTASCTTPPETLRAAVEAKLQQMPVWGTRSLLLDVYTLARNVASELGTGTAEEQAAVIFAGINRSRYDKKASVTEDLVTSNRTSYGSQSGTSPPAATRQDPTVGQVLLADFIYNGVQNGSLVDFTGGAQVYLDVVDQDGQFKQGLDNKSGASVYRDWTGLDPGKVNGDYMTWVGHIAGIRPDRLALFKHRYELQAAATDDAALKAAKATALLQINKAGFMAASGRLRAPRPWDDCIAGLMSVFPVTNIAIAQGFGEADPVTVNNMDWSALLTAGFSLALAGAAGVAIGKLVEKRQRCRIKSGR